MSKTADQTRHRLRRVWIFSLLGVGAATTAGWIAGQHVQSPQQAASEAAPPDPAWITAEVEQRVLAQTVISRGDVRPDFSIAVSVPSSVASDPVITGINVAMGSSVGEGQRLIEVSGRPVFVVQGEVPAYRSMKPGMSGADIVQLQAALGRLGCDTSPDTGTYGEATKLCVAQMYLDAGYVAVPTSPTDTADLAVAEQLVTDADAAASAAQYALEEAAAGPGGNELVAAQTNLAAARRTRDDAVAAATSAEGRARADVDRARAAVDRLQADPTTLAGDLSDARADLDDAIAALGDATRSGDLTVASAEDGVTLAQLALDELSDANDVTSEYIALGQTLADRDRASAALDALRQATGPTIPQGEVLFVPMLPARVQSVVGGLGPVLSAASDAAGSSRLVELAGGELLVDMTITSSERGVIRDGMPVELLDEQSNETFGASVTSIADTVSTRADGTVGYTVVLTPTTALPPTLSGANVRVTITAASTADEVLVVPLAAISSAADGSTNVSVLPPQASDPVTVAVRAGLSADGFVVVEPILAGALGEGDRVVVGR